MKEKNDEDAKYKKRFPELKVKVFRFGSLNVFFVVAVFYFGVFFFFIFRMCVFCCVCFVMMRSKNIYVYFLIFEEGN